MTVSAPNVRAKAVCILLAASQTKTVQFKKCEKSKEAAFFNAENKIMKSSVRSAVVTANPNGWKRLSLYVVPITSTGKPCQMSLYVASA